jgi:hypothetical protein
MEMEIGPLRTVSEIEEYIRKHYGSPEEYHRRRHEIPPALTPKHQVVHKSAAESFLDLCDVAAKSLGMNRQAFFTTYPEQYRKYHALVIGEY